MDCTSQSEIQDADQITAVAMLISQLVLGWALARPAAIIIAEYLCELLGLLLPAFTVEYIGCHYGLSADFTFCHLASPFVVDQR